MAHIHDHCHPTMRLRQPSHRSIVVGLASAVVVSADLTCAAGEVSADDEQFMRMALDEARQGDLAFGCVIVRDGQMVARGRNLGKTNDDDRAWRDGGDPPRACRSRQRRLARGNALHFGRRV